MSNQTMIFAETIAGIKKAVKRRAYETESEPEDPVEPITNRGNKLRKRAKYIREGQLAPANGTQTYKRTISHAGFQRDIISRKPKLYADDGWEIDSDDDDERAQEALAAAEQFDPYAGIRLENLLAPLTAAADLPNHPTLSRPFTSKTLTELTHDAIEMVHKEKATLWKMKQLLAKLSGDHDWVPCGMMETDNDLALFNDEQPTENGSTGDRMVLDTPTKAIGSIKGKERAVVETREPVTNAPESGAQQARDQGNDVPMADAALDAPDAASRHAEREQDLEPSNGVQEHPSAIADGSIVVVPGIEFEHAEVMIQRVEGPWTTPEHYTAERVRAGDDDDTIMEDAGEAPPQTRMRTRAQAQADSDNSNTNPSRQSPTPEPPDETYIHPYFLAPPSAHPDRDVGLPPQEAEELRRLTQMYIQKQEEVCRGCEKLLHNLQKADRMRLQVMQWAKAEGHIGEMSDGEDWYDKDEWDLEEDLKKGADEDEEEVTATVKKPRTRRAN